MNPDPLHESNRISPTLLTVGDDGTHRGMSLPLGTAQNWKLEVTGEIEEPLTFTLDELKGLGWEQRAIPVHCVSAGTGIYCNSEPPVPIFAGVSLHRVLEQCSLRTNRKGTPLARHVLFLSKAPGACGPSSKPHCTTLECSLCLTSGEVFLTGILNGKPLPHANGGSLENDCGWARI